MKRPMPATLALRRLWRSAVALLAGKVCDALGHAWPGQSEAPMLLLSQRLGSSCQRCGEPYPWIPKVYPNAHSAAAKPHRAAPRILRPSLWKARRH